MSGKRLIIKRLDTVIDLSTIFGYDGLMNQAFQYQSEISYASRSKDESLLCSALKLSSRFLCTAACSLIYAVARDMADARQDHKDIRIYVKYLKDLMQWL